MAHHFTFLDLQGLDTCISGGLWQVSGDEHYQQPFLERFLTSLPS